MSIIKKEFPGSQATLYLATSIITENVRKRLQNFTNFSNRYNSAYLTEVDEQAEAARLLADDSTRTMGHETVRLELVLTAAVCLKRFRAFKRYIAFAFPENTQLYWSNAGWNFYTAASNQKWQAVKSLCEASLSFMSANLVALSASQNMPAGFVQTFEDAFEAFTVQMNLFYQKTELAKTGTETKLIANNALYRVVMDNFCLAGQTIFEDSPAVSSEYSYEAVSAMISPDNGSGIVAEIVRDEDGVMVAMPNVELSIIGTDKSSTTDAQGRGELQQLASGAVKLRVVADGFEERIIDMELTGTTKHINIVMVPLFEGEFEIGSAPAEEVVSQKS
ncbi:MAG: carboxypeptidase-like regulatory domain-containing protein [Bacteroidia bacterium]